MQASGWRSGTPRPPSGARPACKRTQRGCQPSTWLPFTRACSSMVSRTSRCGRVRVRGRGLPEGQGQDVHFTACPLASAAADVCCHAKDRQLTRRAESGGPSEGRSSEGLPAGTVLRVQLDARDDRWLARLARSIKRPSGVITSPLLVGQLQTTLSPWRGLAR